MQDEVRALLGADVTFPTPPDPSLLGGRNARSLRHTTEQHHPPAVD
jgi:hypothetical protein